MASKPDYAPLDKPIRKLRWLCVAYIMMLVLEGSLRKWALPQLSDALLLARDPIVLLAYFIAVVHRVLPLTRYLVAGLFLAALWVMSTLLFGHENPFVCAFGFRVNFLHVPFAFIMGLVFYRSDVIWVGKWWLWATIAMTVLIVLQFSMPQSAWVNRSVGGAEGAGFSGALGKFRPPGTFSFIIGVVWFYAYSTAFLVAGISQHKRYSKLLLGLSAISIIIALPVSISRMLVFVVGITFCAGMLISALQKGAIQRYLRIIVFIAFGMFVACQIPVFDEAIEAFMHRWDTSTSDGMGGVQGQVFDRIINEFLGPFKIDSQIPFLGEGLGAGTQVGAKMLTGLRAFSLGEAEWFRITGEGGIILGGMFIAWRIWLAVTLAKYAFVQQLKGNGLSMILLSVTAYNVLVGQIGQTTVHGFMIVGIGLTIASLRERKTKTIQTKPTSEPAT